MLKSIQTRGFFSMYVVTYVFPMQFRGPSEKGMLAALSSFSYAGSCSQRSGAKDSGWWKFWE